MSLNIRTHAEYQRERASRAWTQKEARARRIAADRLEPLADHLDEIGFPMVLQNRTLLDQDRQPNRTPNWLIEGFEEFASTANPALAADALEAAQGIRRIAADLQDALSTPTPPGPARNRRDGKSLGALLTEFREHRGFRTGAELAKRVGVTPSAISHVETDNKQTSIETACKIIRACGANPTDPDVLNIIRKLMEELESGSNNNPFPSSEQVRAEIARLQQQRPDLLTLGSYLAWVRGYKKIDGKILSQREFSSHLGVDHSMVDRYESNRAKPVIFRLIDWMLALGLTSRSLEASVAWAIALEQESKK